MKDLNFLDMSDINEVREFSDVSIADSILNPILMRTVGDLNDGGDISEFENDVSQHGKSTLVVILLPYFNYSFYYRTRSW